MREDLANVRVAAAFLSKTELAFDLVSAVDELASQIKLEFDFVREAAVGDEIGACLDAAGLGGSVTTPRSVPGLVTRTAFVMDLLPGEPLLKLAERAADSRLPAAVAAAATRRVVFTLVDAYGAQMLGPARLFQADPHPGNVLVDATRGTLGLLDFGQSKRLTSEQQRALARLMLAMAAAGDTPLEEVKQLSLPIKQEIAGALAGIGFESEVTPLGKSLGDDVLDLRVATAFRAFETRGRVNPFAADSTIKRLRITSFPPSLFFVLRTIQMLRGVSAAAGVEVSVAVRWKDRARAVLDAAADRASGRGRAPAPRPRVWAGGPVPGGVASADGGWAVAIAGAAAVPSPPAVAAGVWATALVLSAAGAAAGAVAAARAAGAGGAAHPTTAGAAVVALWAAAVGLQASWPSVLLVARHPAAALAHGVTAGAALAAAALAAVRANAAPAALAMAPHGLGVAAGLAVNIKLLWSQTARERRVAPVASTVRLPARRLLRPLPPRRPALLRPMPCRSLRVVGV